MTNEAVGNFVLVEHFKLKYADEITVSKWRSRESGLTVVHLDYSAPIVKGYFVVATEIFNDSGCPHTLEHLIFQGSENYPHKGTLGNLANRAFATHTNAGTTIDYTAYTISTAGSQGFLQLLPVYVDHILWPTLKPAGFTTEVYHINGKAQDAGVVYSEMQGRENTVDVLTARAQQSLFYPKTSAYRSEVGGMMEALRKLTLEEIRNYHATYYVPHNLCLIIAGSLSTETLLDTVNKEVEPVIAAHGQAKGPRPGGWRRPFLETPSAETPKIQGEKQTETIEFPEKDESAGKVLLTFVGPLPNAFLERKAIDILGTYLTDSPVSPLTREYVEISSPLCARVYFSQDICASFCGLDVEIDSVPTEHLETIDERLKGSLKRIVEKGIDMERMRVVLKTGRLKLSSELESNGGDRFYLDVIRDFLYGREDGKELQASMWELGYYDALDGWSSGQWADILRKYYIDAPSIVIRGKPSAQLADRLEAEEKARIAKQSERLGPEGLVRLEKELEAAKKENDAPIPAEVLIKFPVPDIKSISWIPVQSVRNDSDKSLVRLTEELEELAKHLAGDAADLPYFVQFDHVKSEFVSVTAYLSTASLPDRLRPYVAIYLSSFFSLPVVRADDTKLSHEDVINQLKKGTVSYNCGTGVGSLFKELVRIDLKVEISQYEFAIGWLHDLIFNAQFVAERLAVAIAKFQRILSEWKRDASRIVDSVLGSLTYDKTSTAQAKEVTALIEIIPKLAQDIKESPEAVIKDFEELRSRLINPTGLRFSVTGNVLAVNKPRGAWSENFPTPTETALVPVPLSKDTLSPLGKNPVKKAVVVTLPTTESSFAIHITNSISGFNHPEHPALCVAVEILQGGESFLWKSIRGAGLAYGANILLQLESGLLSFQLYRSPDSFKAFEEASKVVRGLADGSIVVEETSLEAAKSSLVCALARQVSTPARAASVSFVNQALKSVPQDHGRRTLEALQKITVSDVRDAIGKYILPLFNSSSSIAVVVSGPAKVDEIAKGLMSVGFEVEKRTLPGSA
ncbi:hypothetical protein BOTBODRAFT_26896 [Botryobasidium botryosum FD-172 SS1]|uniref:Mitochondrial presequence protease n=1 Tax=Botryobasidium botryosum (strain FD-172 SS1) TaxID=930990 RepID=A0A067N1S3_BOTB1|nr:hypothetical protein BOTBODRAFT_26896 [Botryobasidium botryosum FD-172 SS1]